MSPLWISRTAYDAVCAERDFLRGELARSNEHLRRMERVERGLGETQPAERAALPPMPELVQRALSAIGQADSPIRRKTEESWIRRAKVDGNWKAAEKAAATIIPQSKEEG